MEGGMSIKARKFVVNVQPDWDRLNALIVKEISNFIESIRFMYKIPIDMNNFKIFGIAK